MSNETKNEPFAKGIRELAEMALSTARVMDDEAARDEIEAELRKRLGMLLEAAQEVTDATPGTFRKDAIKRMHGILETWR